MTCPTCLTLLSQGVDLSIRAQKLDADVAAARKIGRGCGTPALWVMQQYDRDLDDWQARSTTHLKQGDHA